VEQVCAERSDQGGVLVEEVPADADVLVRNAALTDLGQFLNRRARAVESSDSDAHLSLAAATRADVASDTWAEAARSAFFAELNRSFGTVRAGLFIVSSTKMAQTDLLKVESIKPRKTNPELVAEVERQVRKVHG
jgi:hypothetical protein